MRIDMHVHTEYSFDSLSKPEQIAKVCKLKGLDGIAITDHNTCEGWEEMIRVGKKFELRIVKGVEMKFHPSSKKSFEVLALFLQEPIKDKELFEVLDEVEDQDGIIAIPHPFDPLKGNPKEMKKILERINAIEVFNSRVPNSVYNQKALRFAERHGLGMVGGSDAHTPREVGNAYTLANANDLNEFREAILKRKTKVEGKLTNHLVRRVPSMIRFLRGGKKFKALTKKIVEKSWKV